MREETREANGFVRVMCPKCFIPIWRSPITYKLIKHTRSGRLNPCEQSGKYTPGDRIS